jgi:hypothetical protein
VVTVVEAHGSLYSLPMASNRPSFDEVLAFWRELLRSRALPTRLTWVFREDVHATANGDKKHFLLRPRSAGAGEWLARRVYDAASPNDTLAFAACANADGHTITSLQGAWLNAGEDVRRDDWNLLFDTSCHLQNVFSIAYAPAVDSSPDPSGLDYLIELTPLRERLMANDRIELRREALRDLALFASPVASVRHSLTDFAWDSDELSMLDKQHVLSVLRRFDVGEITSSDVEAWANAIEMRDDIDYDRETAVWDVLYELANPTLTEPLTRERSDVLASVLKGH